MNFKARRHSPFVAFALLATALVLQAAGPTPTPGGSPIPQTNQLDPSSSAQKLAGTLTVVWGDPHPDFDSGGETRYALTLSDGTVIRLQLAGQENVAASSFNKPVVVSGRLAVRPSPVTGTQDTETLVVDTITPGETPQADQSVSAAVVGSRKVIYLLVKFSGDTAPHPPGFYTNFNNPDTPPPEEVFPTTINGFFKKTSWNQFSWIGAAGGVGGVGASGGWLTLPGTKSYYANCGWSGVCANLNQLSADAVALGKAQGIDFTTYDNINFVLSNDLDCCAWGGGYSLDGKSYGATWSPPWAQEADTYSHEMGHSLGLPHSGWVYFAYDSPFDTMSAHTRAAQVSCGSYSSANSGGTSTITCTEPGGGYISPHKDILGWIPPAYTVVTDTASSLTVTLEALALPLGSAAKMIKICLPGYSCESSASTARYFTVEARVKALGSTSQYDNAIPGEGIVIHDVQKDRPSIGTGNPCFFNSQSGFAVPVDATPGDYDSANCSPGGRILPNYALYNAQWTPGQTYVNSTKGFSVSVLSRSGSTFVVSVGAALPATPTGIVAVPAGHSGVTVRWSAAPSTTSYNVKRSTVSGAETMVATGVTSTSYVDGGLVTGKRYYYVVSAVNASGEGANSSEVSAASLLSIATSADADGDGRADLAVYRPSIGYWYMLQSSTNYTTYLAQQWGVSTDIVVAGDYDGDGKTDLGLYRPSTGYWYILQSSTNYTTYLAQQWGSSTDIAVVGDYDGDDKTDLGLYRPSTGFWYVLLSSTNFTTYLAQQWGLGTDIVVAGDYDGDGKTDLGLYRPSTGYWYILQSSTNYTTYFAQQWGLGTDTAVAGDYDGDGKTDLALYRPSTGYWYILQSSTNYATYLAQQWGLGTDIAVVGDYDGDGKTDLGLYRPSTGFWYVLLSSTNFTTYLAQQWGLGTDIPVLRRQ